MTTPLKVLDGGTTHTTKSAWMHMIGQHGTLVRCDKNKRPIDEEWQKKALSITSILSHLDSGGLVGIVPGTIGWWVIDQDHGHPDIIAGEIEHIAFTIPSKTEGHYHHWVRRKPRTAKNREIGNSKWQHQDCSGEIRGDRGFVVIWDVLELVQCLKTHTKSPKIDPQGCPILRKAPIQGSRDEKKSRDKKARPTSKTNNLVHDQIMTMRGCGEGERNETLNVCVYTVYKRGLGGSKFDEDITEAALHAGLEEAEIKTTLESARSAGVRDHIGEDAEDPAKLGEALAKAMREQQSDLKHYENRTLDEVEKAVEDLGYRFRYNTLTGRVESQKGSNFWEDVSNNTANIRRRLECECVVDTSKGPVPFLVSKDRFGDLMEVYSTDPTRRQNPLVEWVRRLPAWDGVKRLEQVFQATLGAEDNELTRWAGNYLFAGSLIRSATADIDGTGHSLDQMLFLIGPQGVGKTRFLKSAVPPRMVKHWVCGDFSMKSAPKDKLEKIIGKIFIEIPEITFDKFFSVDDLKAFLSVTHDEVRLPYQRRTEVFARTATFVATVNHEEGLPDDVTGNRRFVPLKCAGIPAVGNMAGAGWSVAEWWDHNREQLWAEAWVLAQRVISGTTTLNMNPVARALLAERYEDARISDGSFEEAAPQAAYDVIYDQVYAAYPDLDSVEISGLLYADIWLKLDEFHRRNPMAQTRLSRELTRAGWKKRRVRVGGYKSNPLNRWFPPEGAVDDIKAQVLRDRTMLRARDAAEPQPRPEPTSVGTRRWNY